ncbi:TniQ family protein [Bacillaceae bacterium CLA-AA-H227]|uniref:TniQ family protein n=1 Tax=Robertmurraya yapensis (ex Hitch et al 2024) TaxID=3133160 RepID=A0ACC6SFQ9_9BACI
MHESKKTSSTLYNLVPIEINTKFVESLSSYIMRIAYEHNISIGDLINKLVVPQMNKEYLKRSSQYGGNRFYEGAKTINGYMENAKDLVNAMELLTSRSHLAELTLLKWKNFIPLRGLLKHSLSWCPKCIDNKLSEGEIIYYPLVWYIGPMKVCIKHHCFLAKECGFCKKEIEILRRQMIPGYCPYCFNPLTKDNNSPFPNTNEMEWQAFVSNNIEELLEIDAFQWERNSPRKKIISQLSAINEELFLGSYTKFSNYLGISKSTLRYWMEGKNVPTLYNLLHISYRFNNRILYLLQGSNHLFETAQTDTLKIREVNRAKKFREKLNHNVIENKLNYFHSVNPPISMSAVSKRVGHDKRILYKHYPESCKLISKRYSEFLKYKSNNRIETLKEEIEKVFESLINEGIYPSRRKIEAALNRTSVLKEKKLQDHWRELLIKYNLYKGTKGGFHGIEDL